MSQTKNNPERREPKELTILGTTTKCVYCLEETYSPCGHLLKGKGIVLAGRCSKHLNLAAPNLLNRKGCYGYWNKAYGFTKETELYAN